MFLSRNHNPVMKKLIKIVSIITISLTASLFTSCNVANVAGTNNTVHMGPSALARGLQLVGNAQTGAQGGVNYGSDIWHYTSYKGKKVRVNKRTGQSYYYDNGRWIYFKTVNVNQSRGNSGNYNQYRGTSGNYSNSGGGVITSATGARMVFGSQQPYRIRGGLVGSVTNN